jgi:hypothetical protein
MSGIRTQNPSVQVGENISCLRPRCHSDRPIKHLRFKECHSFRKRGNKSFGSRLWVCGSSIRRIAKCVQVTKDYENLTNVLLRTWIQVAHITADLSKYIWTEAEGGISGSYAYITVSTFSENVSPRQQQGLVRVSVLSNLVHVY